ncbi:MAG: cytochrome P450 [Chthoniobacterales bacterium]
MTFPLPLDLTHPEVCADPYPVYRWYRENSPVHRVEPPQADGVPRYLVTRWSDVEAGLKNPVLKRSVHRSSLWNQPLENVPPALQAYARVTREWPLFRDPPHHAPARRLVNRVLDEPGHSAILETILRQTLDDLAARKTFDAAEDFARRVALQLNLAMLGLDNHGWQEFGAHLQSVSLGFGNHFDQQRLEQASAAMETLENWITEAAGEAGARTKPAPFLERLLSMQTRGIIQSAPQLAATAILFIQAGQDTTSALMANGILTLLRHPAVVQRLIAEPDFAPPVLEEILRFETPVQLTTWHASVPLEIRGVPIQPGEGVSFLLGAANRDPEAFENPDDFDPTQRRTRTAAFGFGPHTCPGADFGREIAATSLSAFFRRFPHARLASETVTWKPLATFRSVGPLEVTV